MSKSLSGLSEEVLRHLESQRDPNGRFYLDLPREEKERAKPFGARWDRTKRRWFAPPGTPLGPLQEWFPPEAVAGIAATPPPPVPNRAELPRTRSARLARYYRLVLELSNLDDLAKSKASLATDFDSLASGHLDAEQEKLGQFFQEVRRAQESSPEPLHADAPQPAQEDDSATSEAEAAECETEAAKREIPSVTVLVLFTLQQKRVLFAIPASLSEPGYLTHIGDLLPLVQGVIHSVRPSGVVLRRQRPTTGE